MGWIKLSFFHILIFIIFYYYFISPIRIELSNALLTEKQVQQELRKKQKSYPNKNSIHKKIYITHLTKEALIKHFVNKIAASKFLIEEIYPTQIQKHGNLIKISFKVMLLGDIFQLKKLIDQLSKDQVLINIDEIFIKNVEKSKIKTVMKIDVFNVVDAASMAFSRRPYVLQWIGYTEKNKTIKGLLRLEDGNVLEVAADFVIHKDLKILRITKEQMLVQVGDHVTIIKYGKLLEV